MRILQLVSCRGWSSDAYWTARISRELARRGHEVIVGFRAGTETRVIDRARAEGVERTLTFEFASGVRPGADLADLRRLRALLPTLDVVHVHRGQEHWLAAVANRLVRTPRPVVRTRHIVQPVRPHAGNRWLYRRATTLVVTVTEGIRRQYVASGLLDGDRVVAIPGGADIDRYRPARADPTMRAQLGGVPNTPLVGMIAGFRAMKGHAVVIEAAARLLQGGARVRFTFIGRGAGEPAVRESIRQRGLHDHVTLAGFADDLCAAMAALDVALYVPFESDGMSRVVFEYLAAGRPLVASRVGLVPEVLADDEHALLVPAGDAGALAQAIARLLDDPALRAQLGSAARRLVEERYSGARVAAALEARYAQLLPA